MESNERLSAVSELLKAKLPSILQASSLRDFELYKTGESFTVGQNTCAVITINRMFTLKSETHTIGIIFDVFSGDTDVYVYESVLTKAINNLIKPELVGMVSIEKVEVAVTPPSEDDMVSILYSIDFGEVFDTEDWEEEE